MGTLGNRRAGIRQAGERDAARQYSLLGGALAPLSLKMVARGLGLPPASEPACGEVSGCLVMNTRAGGEVNQSINYI